jgi:hypothetical protein
MTDWMQTSTGGRFIPGAPEMNPIWMSDIANGLALTVRYGGQGRVDRFYSVAEHCWHLSHYAERQGKGPDVCMAVLLHDAAEAFLGDIPRPVKTLIGPEYARMENRLLGRILREFGAAEAYLREAEFIKDIDTRILKHEKEELFDYPLRWPCDDLEDLEGVVIICLEPRTAKLLFLERYSELCRKMGRPVENWEV